MTFDHRILVSLDEVQAIVFQCNKCQARISIAPSDFDAIPGQCPNAHIWKWQISSDHNGTPFTAFSKSLKRLRDKEFAPDAGFKILLEFNDARR
jgi:hypothetical protein